MAIQIAFSVKNECIIERDINMDTLLSASGFYP